MIWTIPDILQVLAYSALGSLVAFPLLWLNVTWAPRLGLIDWPKARGVAEEQIPIIGHSIVLLTFFCMIWLFGNADGEWLIVTSGIIGMMGFLDDRRPLSAVEKLMLQVICVSVLVTMDPRIQENYVEEYGIWGGIWAGIFIIGLTNAVNFIDGIDGLAGMVISFGCLGLILVNPLGFGPFALFGALVLGMIAPFLYLNVMKRKGFMGNVGSYFFAYVLATFHLYLPIGAHDPLSRVCMSALCFLIPMADSIMVVISRMSSLRSPFSADKGHLHHRLIQTSIPLRYVLLNFGIIESFALAISFVVATTATGRNTVLPIVLCVSHVSITSILILLVEKASRRRIQNYFQRLDSGEPIYFMKYKLSRRDGSPISSWNMARIEATVCAEVRVTDLCFSQGDELYITVRSGPHPFQGMTARLERIFDAEQVRTDLIVEQGELVKVSRRKTTEPPKKEVRISA